MLFVRASPRRVPFFKVSRVRPSLPHSRVDGMGGGGGKGDTNDHFFGSVTSIYLSRVKADHREAGNKFSLMRRICIH